MGADLNRTWQEPSEWGHPTIHAARQMLHSLDADKVTIQTAGRLESHSGDIDSTCGYPTCGGTLLNNGLLTESVLTSVRNECTHSNIKL